MGQKVRGNICVTFYQTAADRQVSKGPGYPSWSKQWIIAYTGCVIQSLDSWAEGAAVFSYQGGWLNYI